MLALVFKSLVRSGYLAKFDITATTTSFPFWKYDQNQTESGKNQSQLLNIGHVTILLFNVYLMYFIVYKSKLDEQEAGYEENR